MTQVYLVRHCEAIGNVKKLFQGRVDLDITENGEKQLECLTKRFENIDIDKVYASPLLRTRKTAKAIIGRKRMDYTVNDGLVEIGFGKFEGRIVEELFSENTEVRDCWINTPHKFESPEGEHMADVYARIYKTVTDIARENEGKTVACATHGGVLRCLLCKLTLDDIEKLYTVPFSDNTAVTLLEFDSDFNCTVKYANDISHLTPDLRLKKSAVVGGKMGGDK